MNSDNFNRHPSWKQLVDFLKSYRKYFADFETLFGKPVDGKWLRVEDDQEKLHKIKGQPQQYKTTRQYLNLDTEIKLYRYASGIRPDFVSESWGDKPKEPIKVTALGEKHLREGTWKYRTYYFANESWIHSNYELSPISMTKKRYGLNKKLNDPTIAEAHRKKEIYWELF